MSAYVIGYDIADPARLQRVHRELIGHATPLEYSIFLFEGSQRQLAYCLSELEKLIEPKEDDLRCYPLPERGLKQRIGKTVLPEGIIWTGLPVRLN